MILARFRDLEAARHARERMADESPGRVELYTPRQVSEEGPDTQGSLLPLLMLLAGLGGAVGFFLLQTYSDVSAWPMNIGGRPDFSWPPYIVNAFEVGVLCAMLTGLVGFFAASRMPRLYHPVDRFYMFHEASRDGYFLLIDTPDPVGDRERLDRLHPLRVEEMA